MNARLVYIQSSREPWAEEALELYTKKLKGFGGFETLALKAKSIGRDNAEKKKRLESELLASKIENSDLNILLDENGKPFPNSIAFSDLIAKGFESHRRISFFVGGAYGVSDEQKNRFDRLVSLSGLTMNHQLAKVVILEQFYRSLTIIKGIPYHNI